MKFMIWNWNKLFVIPGFLTFEAHFVDLSQDCVVTESNALGNCQCLAYSLKGIGPMM